MINDQKKIIAVSYDAKKTVLLEQFSNNFWKSDSYKQSTNVCGNKNTLIDKYQFEC